MRKIFSVFMCLLPLVAAGQAILDKPLSARLTGYDIDVTLDPEKHIVSGMMTAWWVNNSSMPVGEAMMHMYLNAFSSNKSTFASRGNWSASGKDGWGWVKVSSMSDRKGNDLSGSYGYISPDDGNEHDKTVLRIALPEPVAPGDTLVLKLDFISKLPSPIRRTGYDEDFHFVAQWFPKFGVYETAGMRQREADGWNCHQFHPNSEFYSNHSVYNVSVTLPSEFVTGSGGMLIEEIDLGDGLKKVVWRAEDIVDFAWTAWPGYEVLDRKWNHVDITLLTSKTGLSKADNHFEAVIYALEYLNERVGPYPWPHLTFVDPPFNGSGAGGMEYTTLFTTMGAGAIPSFMKMAEMVTIHEFGHSYFMGMLASNEFEEPWVDEGINSYWEQRIVDHYYGDGYGLLRLPFLKMSDADQGRISYVTSPNRTIATNDLPSWMYPHGTYSMMSYNKAAVWLHTLEGIIGTETMDNVFREYYRRWAFKHPSGQDFIAVVNDVVKNEHGNRFGEDMNWFFNQVLYGQGECDYRVSGITSNRIRSYSGVVNGDSVTYTRSDRSSDTLYLSRVSLERLGEVILPVEVLIGFDTGEEVLENWDGTGAYKDYEYTGVGQVVWAKIDPYDKIDIDINRMNNSFTLDPSGATTRRMMNKFMFLVQMMISIFTL
ncbi:MAG TPA: M1 family metallopeptidase [Bacteroidales bacterium]|nr:M1 family metallopeptidase [Bacteroidales bacterium]HNT93047.1 M1 family metallopeptidase [Bacteroidales bacterium]HOO67491.1 M1 family metallopeptidase [Bacteroidales bacterium]